MKFGNITIGGMSFGSTRIGGAKLGNTLVYQAGSPTPPGPTPTFVDYIQTDGVAYINTGIKGNAPISVKLFEVTPVAPATGNAYLCGCRKDSGNTRMFFLSISSTGYAGMSYAGSSYASDIDVSASINNRTPMNVQTTIKAGSQKLYVKQDGESSYTLKSHSTTGTITTNTDIFVFAMNAYGTVSHAPDGTRIKELHIYSDNSFANQVFDGYACYYNGEYGMWDNISNSFFGNAAGSGAFTGPSI